MPPINLSDPYNTVLIGLLTFLVGLYLGHHLSLWRDRRGEFNAIAERLYDRFQAAADGMGNRTRIKIESGEFERFVSLLWIWRRSAFRKAWADYQTLQKYKGDPSPDEQRAMHKALRHLKTFTKFR